MQCDNNNRVAFVAPSLRGGGAERVMLDLAIGFAEMGFHVDLVLVAAEGPYLELVPESVRLINLASKRTYKALPAMVLYLRRERPTAVLSTLNNVNVLVVWAKVISRVSARVVVREPTTPSRRFASANSLKKLFFWLLKRQSYLLADKIVAVSAGVGEDLFHFLKIPEQDISVIYNPVNDQDILRNAQEVIHHRWFSDVACPPVIIAVGRLSKEKDYETLLHAFSLVRKRVNSKLLILGEGEERVRLETIVDQLNLSEDVDMPGFVLNPFPYIAKAKTLVLTSVFEGLPNVLIQAMVLGTPVVSTDCVSGPSEILDHGKYGDLVNVGDREALADRIVNSIAVAPSEEQIVRMVERGRFFSVKKALDDYRKVLIDDKALEC